ncbi:hypothetical protein [Rhizobium sp.]
MSKSRRAIVIVALILAVVVVAGRFLRKDAAYLHASKMSEIQDCRPSVA